MKWRLKELMDINGVEGAALAEAVGLSPEWISRLRNSDAVPTISGARLEKLADGINRLGGCKVLAWELVVSREEAAGDVIRNVMEILEGEDTDDDKLR